MGHGFFFKVYSNTVENNNGNLEIIDTTLFAIRYPITSYIFEFEAIDRFVNCEDLI